MNTYSKFCPNVFLAKCTDQHSKGDEITVTTKRGKDNLSIVHNLIYEKDGFFFYSITRSDGFDKKAWAERKAEKAMSCAGNAEKRGNEYYNKSNKDKDFLRLAEPIKVGHHSERRHRKMFEDTNRNFGKYVEEDKKAESYKDKAAYYESIKNDINLSMPESLEFYKHQLEDAKENHKGLKDGSIPRSHAFSLTYAKKKVNELSKKLELAESLWG